MEIKKGIAVSPGITIARALINEPEKVLADEHTGDLDEENAQQIIQILLSYVERIGATLVVVTNGDFPAEEADRLWHLRDGVLLSQ